MLNHGKATPTPIISRISPPPSVVQAHRRETVDDKKNERSESKPSESGPAYEKAADGCKDQGRQPTSDSGQEDLAGRKDRIGDRLRRASVGEHLAFWSDPPIDRPSR